MDSLKAVLAVINQPSPEVLALLDCLNSEEFALDVCICSYGGVGSTALHNFLEASGFRLNLLSDKDGLKHSARPPQFAATGRYPKVVYLFGDPLLSIASHYRRGQAHHQAMKTSGNTRLRQEDFPRTLELYMARGEDLFGYAAHFQNWLSLQTEYPILFVRYESMFETDVALKMFSHICRGIKTPDEEFELSRRFCALKRPRLSSVPDDMPTHMYAELNASMANLPDVFLRSPSGAVESVVH